MEINSLLSNLICCFGTNEIQISDCSNCSYYKFGDKDTWCRDLLIRDVIDFLTELSNEHK